MLTQIDKNMICTLTWFKWKEGNMFTFELETIGKKKI